MILNIEDQFENEIKKIKNDYLLIATATYIVTDYY